MTTCLLDTGPLVAYLDETDPWHDAVSGWFGDYAGRICTTSAVITEVMHFVSRSAAGPELAVELLASIRARVFGSERVAELRAAADLVRRYDDVPMDYADATLLLLADRLGVEQIATLDRRGFAAYRTPAGRALRHALDFQ